MRDLMMAGSWLCLLVMAAPSPALAQRIARPGPVIEAFGAVYDIPGETFVTPKDRAFRVVFEVAEAPADTTVLNRNLETVARFLNMHVRAGVPRDSLFAAVVLHGPAARATLRNEAYRARFGVDNPDLALLEALHAAGVRIILCGQSSMSRGFYPELVAAPVQIALSAMTALTVLRQDGYLLNPF